MKTSIYLLAGFAVISVLVFVLSRNFSPVVENPMYRFDVANETLFAIASDPSYLTQIAVYQSDDLGDTWTLSDVPAKTRDLAGNGHNLYALTSDGDIWVRRENSAEWQVFNDEAGASDYLYMIDVDSSGRVVSGSKDGLRLYDQEGRVTSKYASEDRRHILGNARFLSGDEQILLADADPYQLYVIDLRTQEQKLWTEGFRTSPPEGMHGPCRVREYGDGYLVSTYDGIYFAPGLLEPWQPLTEELKEQDYFAGFFCRDLQSHQPDQEEWIVARNAGISLMKGSTKEELIYEDVADELDLIDAITPFGDYYFVSFHRHQNGRMGVKISQDLKEVKVLTLQMQSAASTSETTQDD